MQSGVYQAAYVPLESKPGSESRTKSWEGARDAAGLKVLVLEEELYAEAGWEAVTWGSSTCGVLEALGDLRLPPLCTGLHDVVKLSMEGKRDERQGTASKEKKRSQLLLET